MPVLKIQNVKPFAIDLKKMAYVSSEKFQQLKRHAFSDGDIVMTKLGNPLGASAIIHGIGQGIIVADLVRIRAQNINTRYLCYHLNSKRTNDALNLMQKGTTRPRVMLSCVRDLPIKLPSLPEQLRIVRILDECFTSIAISQANVEKNLQNARTLFQFQLDKVYKRLTFDHREVPLSSLLTDQPRNGWSPPLQYQTGTGIPVLTLSSVTGFKYDGSRVKLSSAPTKDSSHYWLQPGNLLVTRSNTQDLVGHAAIYDGNPAKAICCDLIMKMQVDPAKAQTRFVYFCLRSTASRLHIISRAHGASSTMKKIGKQVVQNIPIALPSLDEQKQTTTALDAMEGQIQLLNSIYESKLIVLKELRQTLLHQAFAGDL